MTFCLQHANEWCMENCQGKDEEDECILWNELEKMKERLDEEIREAFKTAYELYRRYQEDLRREGRSMLIDVDGDCEVWE